MGMSDVQSQHILSALSEYEAVGRDVFLEKYGFKPSRKFFLEHNGKRYDSKPILGAAHGYARPDLGTWSAQDFSGGESGAARVLRGRGFRVVGPQTNPDWTTDELILATEFYKQHLPNIPGKTSQLLIDLSEQIQATARMLGLSGGDTFRNPNGVYMKLMELRKYDPTYAGKGLGRQHRQVELDVWNMPDDALKAAAGAIRAQIVGLDPDDEVIHELLDSDFEDAPEGRLVSRAHVTRERNRKLVQKKKDQFKRQHGMLFCEACGFNFESVYGVRGRNFIECHHTRPVAQMQPGDRTHLTDLALICSNCHRMVHAKRHWLTLEELRTIILSSK